MAGVSPAPAYGTGLPPPCSAPARCSGACAGGAQSRSTKSATTALEYRRVPAPWRADQKLLRVTAFGIDVEAELGGLEATQLPYRGRLVRSWARTSCGCARIPRGEIGGGDDDRLREK